jgi:hypothetical protein
MRAMLRRFTLLLCLVVALAGLPLAAVAGAQSSPFAPLPQPTPDQSQTPTVATTSSTTTDDSGGLKDWQEILIFAGGGILLLGIAWAIVSDARAHAPVEDDSPDREASRERQEADLKRRKARNRAAAKRSKAARKRNR